MEQSLFLKHQKGFDLVDKAVQRQTERGELLLEFQKHLNINRTGKYKPLSIARVGMLVAHIPTEDLYYFMSICRDAGNRERNTVSLSLRCFITS